MIDKQGRIKGKVSVIDLAIVIVAVGLLIGYGYRTLSPKAVAIVTANTKFYVTLSVERIRDFSVQAVKVGDVIYETYGQQPFGTVVDVETQQSKEIMRKLDGTVTIVPMEERYNILIVLEVKGSYSENGYQVNGNKEISVGTDLRIQSQNVICGAKVYSIMLEKPGQQFLADAAAAGAADS
ncbi:MAG: DUF4330 domain-containing protein [Clostridiales bacterium]|jgi:hypothetical protein|nr:DUF4330 domain-containing protein [Clostridiales bacterium]